MVSCNTPPKVYWNTPFLTVFLAADESEDIQLFLESRGRLQDDMQVGNFMDNLSAVQIATAKQTTLHDFI